jgi:hypothetical protein
MEFILCKNCEHGSPAYLQYCGNCNAALSASTDAESPGSQDADLTVQPNFEVSGETLRKNTLLAITAWCFTTIFKAWVLYSLRSWTFPDASDVLLIISPAATAVIVGSKSKRWYRVLFADSILMILVFVFVLFIFIAFALSEKGAGN